jgi:hypothetical protein
LVCCYASRYISRTLYFLHLASTKREHIVADFLHHYYGLSGMFSVLPILSVDLWRQPSILDRLGYLGPRHHCFLAFLLSVFKVHTVCLHCLCPASGSLARYGPRSGRDLYDKVLGRFVHNNRSPMSSVYLIIPHVQRSCHKHLECHHFIICHNALHRADIQLPI